MFLVTLSRFLRKSRLSYSLVKVKPKLTESHIQKRLEFVKMYQDWTENDWKKAIFADESSVEIGKKYRRKTLKIKGSESFEYRKRKYCIKYIKVWSFISFGQVGDIVVVKDKWNSETFIKIFNDSKEMATSKEILCS